MVEWQPKSSFDLAQTKTDFTTDIGRGSEILTANNLRTSSNSASFGSRNSKLV